MAGNGVRLSGARHHRLRSMPDFKDFTIPGILLLTPSSVHHANWSRDLNSTKNFRYFDRYEYFCFFVSPYQFEVKVGTERCSMACQIFDVLKTKIYQAFQPSIHHLIQLHPRSFIKDNESQLRLKNIIYIIFFIYLWTRVFS